MENGLHFVKADMNYLDVVFEWANESTTRENAFNTRLIPYEEHVNWYEKKIKEAGAFFYICQQGNLNIGQLRIEMDNNRAVISYSVDKNHRGRGLGKIIIKQAEEIIRNHNLLGLEEVVLVGKVKKSNIASQRCFLAQGYNEEILDEYIEFTKIVSV